MTFKFSENETVTDLETVDENLRTFYTKSATEEHFVIKEDMRATATAWDGINGANANIRKENKSLKGGTVDMSSFSEYGTTPAEILANFSDQKKELSDALDKKEGHVNPEKIRTEMKKVHATELSDANKRSDKYKDQLYDQMVTSVVLTAIAEHKGNSELLLGFVSKQIVMKDVDGRLEPWVVDDEGDRKMGSAGSYMTVPELVKNMKSQKKYGALFESDANNGSGPPTNRASSGGPAPTGQKLSAAQRIERGLSGLRRR